MNPEANFDQEPKAGKSVSVSSATDPSMTIPVIEEQLRIDKQVIETGRIQLSKTVTEEEVTVDMATVQEDVDVQRIEVNQYVETAPPPIRYEGDCMIIPVLKEVLVVEKRLMLVEELHITKRKVETKIPQKITLRKEEVTVTRNSPDQTNSGSSLDIDINVK